MATIHSLRAKEIFDSRGNPTILLALQLDTGEIVETSVPNGIRQHPTEAKTLHDQDPQHMDGKGVQKAVNLINQTLAPQVVGQDPTQQEELDQLLLKLDATENKAQTGANSLIAISQAVMKAGALASGRPLYQYIFEKYQLADRLSIPVCLYGLVNGGQYGPANLDIQEFLIIPASYSDYRVSLEIESAIRGELQRVLKEKGANYSTGALGGFTPYLQKNTDVFEFMLEAARKTSYILSRDFFFGIDSGGEQLLDKGKYSLKDKSTAFSEKELQEYYKDLQEKYNLNYFEDPFAAKDVDAWQRFTAELGQTTRIASDILTATNPKLVQKAIQEQTGNTLVVKPSQIGTLTETLQAVRIAREAGWSIVVSQRTGETNDDFLADFAVGIGAEFSKFGPVNRGESVAKYNRLADIYLALEKIIQEGTAMPQTDQPNPTQPSGDDTASDSPATPPTPPAAPTEPAAPAAPTDDSGLPKPTDAPAATPPAGGQAPQPPAGGQPSIQDEVPLAPPTPGATPPDQTAAPAAPAAPTAPTEPTAAPAANQADTQSEAPINTPPAAAPISQPATPKPTDPPKPGEQPEAADMQQAIDSTLQEIGAQPSGTQGGGGQPAGQDQAPAEQEKTASE